MKLKIEGLDMAYSEDSAEKAAQQVAERFGVIVEITGRTGGGGWPEVNVIGTPAQIIKMLTEDGGWSTGDADDDAEMVYLFLKDAKPVFG